MFLNICCLLLYGNTDHYLQNLRLRYPSAFSLREKGDREVMDEVLRSCIAFFLCFSLLGTSRTPYPTTPPKIFMATVGAVIGRPFILSANYTASVGEGLVSSRVDLHLTLNIYDNTQNIRLAILHFSL